MHDQVPVSSDVPFIIRRSNRRVEEVVPAGQAFHRTVLADPRRFDFLFWTPLSITRETNCTHIKLELIMADDDGGKLAWFLFDAPGQDQSARGWVRGSRDVSMAEFWQLIGTLIDCENERLGCSCGQRQRNADRLAERAARRQSQASRQSTPPDCSDSSLTDLLTQALQASGLTRSMYVLEAPTFRSAVPQLTWCRLNGAVRGEAIYLCGTFRRSGCRLVAQLSIDLEHLEARTLLAAFLHGWCEPRKVVTRFAKPHEITDWPTHDELVAVLGDAVIAPTQDPEPDQPPLSEPPPTAAKGPSSMEAANRGADELLTVVGIRLAHLADEVERLETTIADERERRTAAERRLAAIPADHIATGKQLNELRRELERFYRKQLGLAADDPLPPSSTTQFAALADRFKDTGALYRELAEARAALVAERAKQLAPLPASTGQPPTFDQLAAELDEVPLVVLAADFDETIEKASRAPRALGSLRSLIQGLAEVKPSQTVGWLLRRLALLTPRQQERMDDLVFEELSPYLTLAATKQRRWTDGVLDTLYAHDLINDEGIFDQNGLQESFVAFCRQRLEQLHATRAL